jgi:hypothetical protein
MGVDWSIGWDFVFVIGWIYALMGPVDRWMMGFCFSWLADLFWQASRVIENLNLCFSPKRGPFCSEATKTEWVKTQSRKREWPQRQGGRRTKHPELRRPPPASEGPAII